MKTFNQTRTMAATLLIISVPACMHAQSLVVGRGANLVMNGDAKVVLNDASLVNHGSIYAGKSTFIFTGSNPSFIGGQSPANFHHLVVKHPSGQLKLDNDIAVGGVLEMLEGNLELNNHRIGLGRTGLLVGENPHARVTGANGGSITAIAILDAPQNVNPGNLGLFITSAASMGTTVVTRGHVQQVNDKGERSINRYYDIQPSTNANADVSLRFLYLEPELANHQEAGLVLWSKTTNWNAAEKETADADNNWIAKGHVNTMGRFTLGIANASVKSSAGTSLQAYPNPVRDRFTLVVYSDIETTGTVALRDEHGRTIERKQVSLRAGLNNIQWNIGSRAAGTYYVEVENAKFTSLKVIKQ
jgi:hypothetical protein